MSKLNLTALQIVDIATSLNVRVKDIELLDEEGYIRGNDQFYKVINKNQESTAVLEWFEAMGSAEYFLTSFLNKKDATIVLEVLGCDIIENKTLFVKDAIEHIHFVYNEYRYDYDNYISFLKKHFFIEVEDIQNIKKLWDAEVLAVSSLADTEEFLVNVKRYGINTTAVYKAINEQVISNISILSDYNEVAYTSDFNLYRRDI